MLVVAAVVTPFVVAAQTNRWVAANRQSQARLDLLADGLATLLSLRLADPQAGSDLEGSPPTNSSLMSCSHGVYEVRIRLQDQHGLVDLNTASEAMLGAGLRALGANGEEVGQITQAIASFRSYEPEPPGQGASIAITGGRKGAPFESVVELTDFAPLRDFELAHLRQVFTVHSRQGTVMLRQAPVALASLLAQVQDGSVVRSEADASSSSFAVEVTVRIRADGIRGYSGFIVQFSGPPEFRFRKVEALAEPGFGSSSEEADPQGPPCPASIQRDVALVLAEPEV